MRKHINRIISATLAAAMSVSMISSVTASAEETIAFPYTLFAASEAEGAITTTAGNFCVNGNVCTNGTIVTGGNINVNGTKTENAGQDMIYIFDKIDAKYFSGNNVEEHTEDYVLDELNININTPTEVLGEAELTGNININTALKAFEDVSLNGDVKNTNDSVIYSKYGDIVIDSTNVNLNGLVYAPFGDVVIKAQNLNLNNVVIIADSISFDCPSVNSNYSSSVADFVGTVSEPLNIPKDEWQYMKDENGNGLPDFFEDFDNWSKLADTDGDGLPDSIEKYLGSDVNNTDTDGDGLGDFYEVFSTYTDPTKADTDENGVNDGDEDFDKDGLTNLDEFLNNTYPYIDDSDNDGLSDGDEVNEYGTDPLVADTDGDELCDGDELVLGTNPLVQDTDGDGIIDSKEKFNQTFTHKVKNEDCAVTEVSVSMECTGNINKTTSVESIMNIDLMSTNVVGLIGEPFDITTCSDFSSATISFAVDSSLVNSDEFCNLIFLWHDEEEHMYRELETIYDIDNFIVSTHVNHFSKYMVVDRRKWHEVWEHDLYGSLVSDAIGSDIALIIDCSGSMQTNDPMINGTCGRIDAATAFIEFATEKDSISIIAEDSSAKLLCEFTDNKSLLLSSLKKIYSTGGNNFNSSISLATSKLNKLSNSKTKAIILLSDGGSSVSYSTIKYAKDSGIKIYTIGLGASSYDHVLQDISEKTGGEFYKAIKADELRKIYSALGTMKYFDDTDSDGDGLLDVFEVAGMRLENGMVITTDPLNPDSDFDNFLDGEEIVPAYRFLQGSGIPSTIQWGTRSIYFVMNSDPNVSDGYKGEWGKVKRDGIYYSIDIPDHFGTYWTRVWDVVDDEEISAFDSINFLEVIAGYSLNNPKPNIIYPGGNRLDIPVISSDKITIVSGRSALISDLLLNLNNIRVNYDHIKFTFLKSGNMYKVYISGGNTSSDSTLKQYADDIYRYVTIEAKINNCSIPYIELLKSSIKEEYTRLTGKSTGFWDYYDIRVKVDSRHLGAPVYYYWVNSEGRLMEKFNSYPGDQVVIGKYKNSTSLSPFEPLLFIAHDTESHEASEKYQEMVSPVLRNGREM